MVFVRLYQRTSQSYEVALRQYQDRVTAGVQPSTRVVDLFSVDTEEALLLATNFVYLGMVILLYLRMLVSSEQLPLRISRHTAQIDADCCVFLYIGKPGGPFLLWQGIVVLAVVCL